MDCIQYTQSERSGCASSNTCLDLRDLHVEDNVRNVLFPIRLDPLALMDYPSHDAKIKIFFFSYKFFSVFFLQLRIKS